MSKKIIKISFISVPIILLAIAVFIAFQKIKLVLNQIGLGNNPIFILPFLLTILLLIIPFLLSNKKGMGSKHGEHSKSTVYGDADFLDNKMLSNHFRTTNYTYETESKKGAWLVAENINKKNCYWDEEDIHQLVVAPTGSGKTTKLTIKTVIYNLLRGVNIVAVDPKNTFYRLTSKLAKKLHYNVITINFKDTTKSQQWNMLEKINSYADKMIVAEDVHNQSKEENDYQIYLDWRSKMEQEVDELVEKIIAKENNKNANEFFVAQNQSILKSLIIYVSMYADKQERNFGSVIKLLDTMLLSKQKNPFKFVFDNSKYMTKDHPAINSSMLEEGSKDTFANIRVSITNALAQYKLIGLHRLLAYNTFNIRDLVDKKTILYVVVPEKSGASTNLASIFLDFLFCELTEIADNDFSGTLPREIRIIIEELCNIDKITKLPQYLAIIRSRGCYLSLVIQNRGQLISKYSKEDAETIERNCNLVNVMQLHCLDTETAKIISERNGEYTTENASQSVSVKEMGVTESKSYSDQLMARQLTKTNEAIEFNECFVYKTGNYKPIRTDYLPYYKKEFPFELKSISDDFVIEQKPIIYFDFDKLVSKLEIKAEEKKPTGRQIPPNKMVNVMQNIRDTAQRNMPLKDNKNNFIEIFLDNKKLYNYMSKLEINNIDDLLEKLKLSHFENVINLEQLQEYENKIQLQFKK